MRKAEAYEVAGYLHFVSLAYLLVILLLPPLPYRHIKISLRSEV